MAANFGMSWAEVCNTPICALIGYLREPGDSHGGKPMSYAEIKAMAARIRAKAAVDKGAIAGDTDASVQAS